MSNEIVVVGCPFCGETPTVQPWHGGGPHKTLVGCSNDACHAAPAVTGATRAAAIRRWNTRKAPDATVAILDTMTATQAARVLARRASAAPSPARQAASRANGRKGGRPRQENNP